jgi:hypothetical protein
VFFHSLVASLELMVLVVEGIQVHSKGVDSGVNLSNIFAEVLNSFYQQVVLHGGHFSVREDQVSSIPPLWLLKRLL